MSLDPLIFPTRRMLVYIIVALYDVTVYKIQCDGKLQNTNLTGSSLCEVLRENVSGNIPKTPGHCLNIKTVFPTMGIAIFTIRRNSLIFNMGIHKLVRRHLYIETAPLLVHKQVTWATLYTKTASWNITTWIYIHIVYVDDQSRRSHWHVTATVKW